MDSLVGYVAAFLADSKTGKQALADKVGCTLVTFNRKLSGESDLTVSEARRLAQAMGVDYAEIFNRVP